MTGSRIHALIIAGGSGTRFWPESRRALPKQFLSFGGEKSLLAVTADRAAKVADDIWLVCGQPHRQLVSKELPALPESHLIVEPVAKNTGPAIALGLAHIVAADPEATVIVLWADHFVKDEAAFASALVSAVAASAQASVVTLGIVPDRADTGFGYIERGRPLSGGAFSVSRFVEKPAAVEAKRMVSSGNYFWNAGIFVFAAKEMQRLFDKHSPAISRALKDYTPGEAASLGRVFANMPSISIDYAVMEKAEGVAVMPTACGWSDVGTWDALPEVLGQDGAGNTFDGSVVGIDAKNCLVRASSENKTVCLLGVGDLIVVDTPDALLIMSKGQSQRVREVVSALEKTAPERL